MGLKISLLFATACLTLQAQDAVPPNRGIYLHVLSGWVPLPINVLLPFEHASSRWLVGFGRGDAIAELPGPHAQVQTSIARPTFYLRGFPITNGVYLVRETQRRDSREIRMPASRNFQERTHLRESDLIDVDLKPAAGGIVTLIPRADLKPGEYGIISVMEQNYRGLRATFDFGVSPGTF